MAFRPPTHLESLVPSPAEQVPQSETWSGLFTLTSPDMGRGAYQDIYVTAVETDGDSRMDLWPGHLYVYLSRRRLPLQEVVSWVARHSPPVCTFMPDKHPDPGYIAANHGSFLSFSQLLLDNQMVAFAPWNAPDRLPGAGIMIYPTPTSGSVLVGAMFLSGPFPNFITFSQQTSASDSPIQSPQPTFYQTGGASSAFWLAGAHSSLVFSTSSFLRRPRGTEPRRLVPNFLHTMARIQSRSAMNATVLDLPRGDES